MAFERVPFGYEMTMKHIQDLGCSPQLRQNIGIPFLTDNGNYIIDCIFPTIGQPGELEKNLNLIPGVVENGLFVGMADKAIT
ncbi:MAG TPA: ribose-5-phosphate isomerase A [Neobacillus sp.]